jgi:hypothetical protein
MMPCQHEFASLLQEFGKTKLYLPKQDGLEVLSKEVSSSPQQTVVPSATMAC